MNERELRFFTAEEQTLPDCTALPASYLLKSLLVKTRRRLAGKMLDRRERLAWTTTSVSDAEGPAGNVRNYLERRTIRNILEGLTCGHPFKRACEIGCGYGRLIMVLKEFATFVKGFEREPHLAEIGRTLLPDIVFECVESLTCITDDVPYDLVMTCAMLQHLTDAEAREVCKVMRGLAPAGYILCTEKTEAIATTANTEDGARFISRARPVEVYSEFMKPFCLVDIRERIVEPSYFNPHAGSCMVFASPASAGR